MIKIERNILGVKQKEAVVKTMYFATNFDGNCEIGVADFLTKETREAGLSNGVNKRVSLKQTESTKKKIKQINKLAYEILNEQEEFEGGIKV